jgi:hypothetical protein
MSPIKKFTDFFSLFGAFSALIYLITQFMPFEALETDSLFGKAKVFFSPSTPNDYLSVLLLLLFFLASFLTAKILPRFSTLGFFVSLFPLAFSFLLFEGEKLKEHPMLYLISAILASSGAFAECVLLDRADGGRRAPWGTNLCALLGATLSFAVFIRAKEDVGIPPEELGYWDRFLEEALTLGISFSPYWRIALMMLLITLISLLLQGIHFLDTLISLIPLGFVLVYLSTGRLSAFGPPLAVLSATYTLCRLILTLTAAPNQKSSADPDSLINRIRKRIQVGKETK